MSGPAVWLLNANELQREAVMRPILERIAYLVAPNGRLRQIAAEERKPTESDGWMCFVAPQSSGIALQLSEWPTFASPLRQALCRAHIARRVAAEFSRHSPQLVWQEHTQPGDDWTLFTIRFEEGECLCACTSSVTELIPVQDRGGATGRRVRIEAFSEAHSLQSLETGVAEIQLRLPALRVRGFLRVSKGGEMSVRIEGNDSGEVANTAVVRLDLGEIEIGLLELLGLRPGSVIELGTMSPLPCALRIGTTNIAQGVIESVGATLRVRITAGLED